MDRKITREVLAVLTAFLVGGCHCSPLGQGRGLIRAEPSSCTLRIQLPTEPISLDPSLVSDGVSLQVLNNIQEGLMGYDGEGKLGLRLAKSFQVSKDGKTYYFTLREGLRWSDGQGIKVQDFVTAFRRMLNPGSLSASAPLFYGILNAKAYHEGKVQDSALGVQEINGQLVIQLEQRIPSFIHSLTLPSTFPLRQDVLDRNRGIWPETGPFSGPYRIVAHSFEQAFILEKNPYYYQNTHPLSQVGQVGRVEYKLADESTAMNLFDQGLLDIVVRVPSMDIPRLQKANRLWVSPFLATYYLSFNFRKAPFQDQQMRRAVAGAIRRSEIVKILGGGEIPAWSWIPKGLEGYLPYRDPQVLFASSVKDVASQRGKIAIVEAGYDSGVRNSRIMEKIQRDLNQYLNFNINLTPLSWKAYNHLIHSDPPPLFRYGWMAPYLDPITHLKVFTSKNINNFSGFSNLKYDQLVQQVESMEPGEEREKKIFEAQRILIEEEVAVIPIYHYVQHTALSARVKDFKINTFGIIQFKELKLEDKGCK